MVMLGLKLAVLNCNEFWYLETQPVPAILLEEHVAVCCIAFMHTCQSSGLSASSLKDVFCAGQDSCHLSSLVPTHPAFRPCCPCLLSCTHVATHLICPVTYSYLQHVAVVFTICCRLKERDANSHNFAKLHQHNSIPLNGSCVS